MKANRTKAITLLAIAAIMPPPGLDGVQGQDSRNYGEIVRQVAIQLEKEHIRQKPLDDNLAESWALAFVSRLDPHRMYFHRSDFEEFQPQFCRLDDLCKAGDLTFPQSVIDRFKQRVKTAVGYAQQKLNETHDFTRDESVPLVFSEFASGNVDLEERWRLRIKCELLIEGGNSANRDTARDFINSRYAAIAEQYRILSDEQLCELYADSLSSVYDTRSSYLSDKQMELYRTGFVRIYDVGLEITLRNGEHTITDVLPRFRNDTQLEQMVGWNLIAIRRSDGRTQHLTEILPSTVQHVLRSPIGFLGAECDVVLELFNPITRKRVSKTWRRYNH